MPKPWKPSRKAIEKVIEIYDPSKAPLLSWGEADDEIKLMRRALKAAAKVDGVRLREVAEAAKSKNMIALKDALTRLEELKNR